MTRPISSLCFFAILLVGAACSDDRAELPEPALGQDGGSGFGIDAGLDAEASARGPADDLDASEAGEAGEAGEGRCNDLQNVATAVPIVLEAHAPPIAVGGAIADGTYVVTSATTYTGEGGEAGASGATIQMTVQFAWPSVYSVFDGVNRSATLAIDGASLQSDYTWPNDSKPEVAPFSASPSEVQLYLPRKNGTLVYTLTKHAPR